ncbi:MAG TPA: hypothetical protein PKB09_03425 [Candidatus Saccharibacteria bacterium]|nr:hypothetical protein [Candidatus Saccharibacteria bacterium]
MMAETSETIQFKDLQPGDKIHLLDATDLSGFEDSLVRSLYPDWEYYSSRDLWTGRASLQDLIRPPQHYGRIIDVNLEFMSGSFDRLMDARDRGVSFTGKGGAPFKKLSEETRQLFRETTVGFIFRGDAVVTGIGRAARVYSELWYTPSYKSPKRAGATCPIKRIVSKPVIESDCIDEIKSASIERTFELQREGLRRYYSRSNAKFDPIV